MSTPTIYTFESAVKRICEYACDPTIFWGTIVARIDGESTAIQARLKHAAMHVTHALLTADGDVGVKCLDTMCYYIVFRFPGRCCSMTLHVDGSIASYRLKALLMPVAFPPVPVTTALYIVYCDRTCPRQQRMLAFCMGAVKSPKSLVHTLPENILEMVYAQLCDTPVPALVVDDNMWNVFYAWAASLMQ